MAVSSETVARLLGTERQPFAALARRRRARGARVGRRPLGAFGLITIVGSSCVMAIFGPLHGAAGAARVEQLRLRAPHGRRPPARTGWAPTSRAATCSRSSCSARASRSSSALAAGLASAIIGAVVGICAGYFGGWIDRALTFLDDWFLVIPFVPFAVLMAALLQDDARQIPGGKTGIIVLVLAITGWAGTTRIVRAQVLSLRERAVRRARPLTGRLARSGSCAATSCPT